MSRTWNFYAGPATLPPAALERATEADDSLVAAAHLEEARTQAAAVRERRGGFAVADQSDMRDGLLDMTALLRGDGLELDLNQLKTEIDNPMADGNRNIVYRQLADFTIESPEKLHCNLDGEPYLKRKLRFSVLPRHLAVAF